MSEDVELVTIEKYKYDDLKKKEKALEIIKELFIFQPDKFYPFIWKELITRREKIDLLKEVLL